MLRWFVCLSVAMVTGGLYNLWNRVYLHVKAYIAIGVRCRTENPEDGRFDAEV